MTKTTQTQETFTWSAPVPKQGQFQIPQAKLQPAIIVRILDLGLHDVPRFNKTIRKLMISYELPHDKLTGGDKVGQPLMISQEVSFSMHKRAGLRTKVVEPIVGSLTDEEAEKFNILSLLGKPVMLTISHKNRSDDPTLKVAVISGVAPLYDGIKLDKPFNPLVKVVLSNFEPEMFNLLTDKMKAKFNLNEVNPKLLQSAGISEVAAKATEY